MQTWRLLLHRVGEKYHRAWIEIGLLRAGKCDHLGRSITMMPVEQLRSVWILPGLCQTFLEKKIEQSSTLCSYLTLTSSWLGPYVCDCFIGWLVPPDIGLSSLLKGQSCVYHWWFKPVGTCQAVECNSVGIYWVSCHVPKTCPRPLSHQ